MAETSIMNKMGIKIWLCLHKLEGLVMPLNGQTKHQTIYELCTTVPTVQQYQNSTKTLRNRSRK